MYGVATVSNNNSKTITTPLTMDSKGCILTSVNWKNSQSYVNHSAGYYVNTTSIGLFNYRSYSDSTKSITIYWCVLC